MHPLRLRRGMRVKKKEFLFPPHPAGGASPLYGLAGKTSSRVAGPGTGPSNTPPCGEPAALRAARIPPGFAMWWDATPYGKFPPAALPRYRSQGTSPPQAG